MYDAQRLKKKLDAGAKHFPRAAIDVEAFMLNFEPHHDTLVVGRTQLSRPQQRLRTSEGSWHLSHGETSQSEPTKRHT